MKPVGVQGWRRVAGFALRQMRTAQRSVPTFCSPNHSRRWYNRENRAPTAAPHPSSFGSVGAVLARDERGGVATMKAMPEAEKQTRSSKKRTPPSSFLPYKLSFLSAFSFSAFSLSEMELCLHAMNAVESQSGNAELQLGPAPTAFYRSQ